jgi:hypothetical protein
LKAAERIRDFGGSPLWQLAMSRFDVAGDACLDAFEPGRLALAGGVDALPGGFAQNSVRISVPAPILALVLGCRFFLHRIFV